ncbi:beta-glucosidase 1 [Nannizzia gypsea CBS 118893]|uniref:Probable beta-glucosidase E n=1 Tax=Arthroderma gypseum (strain ATCC MYA-4604 / CBS 118893) TaxID=535722 RepID=E5QYB9_ARTGP|nr:beta-glucosidase 1 [Nannizzia gypsea CBS 118893]EFQ97211.1 beta-glucosidase 1 [Nannizzia gypsea CBS 118893]
MDKLKEAKNPSPARIKQRRLLALILSTIAALLTVIVVFLFWGSQENLERPRLERKYNIPDKVSPTKKSAPLGRRTVPRWKDSYLKAQSLVNNMTLVEKVNITTGVGWKMGLCVGNTGPATEVGFPSLCLQDGPLGLRFADNITAFPAGITVGATWNRDLMHRRGEALGREARRKGVNVLLGPAMGPLGVLPAGGRNWEGFGTDPVLQGIASAETILGTQKEGVIATAKHFVLNEQEHFRQPHEWNISGAMSTNTDDRTLHEVYAWPFAESVRAGVGSVMCAYQMVNNTYSCNNNRLLNEILKDELAFQGFIQSDWYGQQTGVASAQAGMDMNMPGEIHYSDSGASFWGQNLTTAVLNGSVEVGRLNDMATRIVAAWYQLKQDEWEKPPPDGNGGPNFSSWTKNETGRLHEGSKDDDQKVTVNRYIRAPNVWKDSHSGLAREIAVEGTVLLKNEDGILPLSAEGESSDRKTKVGVFGEDAGPGDGPNVCPDRSCNQGTLGSGWGSGAVDFPYLVTPWDEIKKTYNSNNVSLDGYLYNGIQDSDLEDKDLCIVFTNANSGEGFASWEGMYGDRNDLSIQKDGNNLIRQAAKKCGKGKGSTIVVLHSVGPVMMEDWIEKPGVKAVILANLPGQESGRALGDVLFGRADATGRLPYTIAKDPEDYGPESRVLYESKDPVPQKNFSQGLYFDYRYFDKQNITPRYEFGFGLSYTSFRLSDIKVKGLKQKSAIANAESEVNVALPSYNESIPDPDLALFPEGFRGLDNYVYPYITSVDDIQETKHLHFLRQNTEEKGSPAGGGEGGNPALFEQIVNVSLTVNNTGARAGKTVVQLYVSFPSGVNETVKEEGKDDQAISIDFPNRVLRNFEKTELQPGQSKELILPLTRKDLSYWSIYQQNWIMPTAGKFKFWAGQSSRDLPLTGEF